MKEQVTDVGREMTTQADRRERTDGNSPAEKDRRNPIGGSGSQRRMTETIDQCRSDDVWATVTPRGRST